MKDFNHPLTSRHEYLKLILKNSNFKPDSETVPIKEAIGRTTAKDIQAINTLPNIPSSNLDGIAIKSAQLDGGIPDTSDWKEGKEYVFSNTGVGIAQGYDTVVPVEDVDMDENKNIKLLYVPVPGQYVKPVGSVMKAGDLLVPANYLLRPAQLALITAGGIDKVKVIKKPKVAILPTGNELVPPWTKVPPGKNIEFNGILIEEKLKMMGAETRLYPITLDEVEDLTNTLKNALGWADIVILNGGTSKGSDDRSIEVLESIGKMLVYEMNYGPGKHTTLTAVDSKLIIGTVGPTVGAEYAIEWYVAPLINSFFGRPTNEPVKVTAKLTQDIEAKMPFDFYIRLTIIKQDGEYFAEPVIGATATLAQQLMANGYMRIPGEVTSCKAGERIEVEFR